MDYIINDQDKSIEYNGVKVFPPRKEFMMFCYLLNNPNRIISRDELLKNIWDEGIIVESRTIDVHMRRIREKLPHAPIITRRCYGYMYKK